MTKTLDTRHALKELQIEVEYMQKRIDHLMVDVFVNKLLPVKYYQKAKYMSNKSWGDAHHVDETAVYEYFNV